MSGDPESNKAARGSASATPPCGVIMRFQVLAPRPHACMETSRTRTGCAFKFLRRETRLLSDKQCRADRWGKAMSSDNPHAHGRRESYEGILPMKRSNESQGRPKEIAEGRPSTKENVEESNPCRTQNRASGSSGLDRVRQAAKENKQLRFTTLLHHVNIALLRSSYYGLKKQAAAGIDGVTWQEYGNGLEERLTDLHGRIHRGAYQAKPSRRVWIPEPDGRKRPLGIAALEDKIVQTAVAAVLNQIWEEDFLEFSYGFRPGRSQHDALDALYVGITRRKVNYVNALSTGL